MILACLFNSELVAVGFLCILLAFYFLTEISFLLITLGHVLHLSHLSSILLSLAFCLNASI